MRQPAVPIPFTLLAADALQGAHGILQQALHGWCADWGVSRDELTLETLRAWEAVEQLPAALSWRKPWRSAAGTMALAWPLGLEAQLQRLLFSPDRQHSSTPGNAHTALAAAEGAWTALQHALRAVAVPDAVQGADVAAPTSGQWRRASGSVLLVVRLGRLTCHAVLDHDAVRTLVRQATQRGAISAEVAVPLPALDHRSLLASLEVVLPVELGRAEVGLGSLMRLEVGDVIRLDTAADRAIRINNPLGTALFDGYLGLADGYVALELTRHDSTFGANNEQ